MNKSDTYACWQWRASFLPKSSDDNEQDKGHMIR